MTRAFAVALSLLIGSSAYAQTYPSKPVRLIVADGPGGPSDLRARQLGVKLGEGLGQAVVVDNRPGGSMIIAAEAAARAPADGGQSFLEQEREHFVQCPGGAQGGGDFIDGLEFPQPLSNFLFGSLALGDVHRNAEQLARLARGCPQR